MQASNPHFISYYTPIQQSQGAQFIGMNAYNQRQVNTSFFPAYSQPNMHLNQSYIPNQPRYEEDLSLCFNKWKEEFESRLFSVEQNQKVTNNIIDGIVHDIIDLRNKTSRGSKDGVTRARGGRGSHRGLRTR